MRAISVARWISLLAPVVTTHKTVSEETAHIIDEEIRNVIDRNYRRAKRLLDENADKLNTMAEALMKYETIDTEQIQDIMDGKEPRPPSDWSDEGPTSGSSGNENTAPEKPKSADGTIGGPASLH